MALAITILPSTGQEQAAKLIAGEVFVKNQAGPSFMIHAEALTKVRELKEKIAEKMPEFPADLQKLTNVTLGNLVLTDDDDTLDKVGIFFDDVYLSTMIVVEIGKVQGHERSAHEALSNPVFALAAEASCKKLRTEVTADYLKEMCEIIKEFEINMLDEVKAVRRQYMEIDHKAKDRSESQELRDSVYKSYVEEMGNRAKAMHESLKPVVEKAFKEHDTKKTNVLDKEEAAAFWDHLMDEQSALAHDLWNMRVRHKIEVDFSMRGIHIITEKEDVARMDKGNEELVQKMLDEYRANKVVRDAAAFKIVDIDGDGTLQLSELTEALIPASKKHTQMMQALGLLDFDPNGAGRGSSESYPGTVPGPESSPCPGLGVCK